MLTGPRSHTFWAWAANRVSTFTYFENLTIELHVLYALTHMSNFVSIECYLLYDLQAYFFMHNFRLQKLSI